MVVTISNLSSIVNMSNDEDQGSVNFGVIVDIVMVTSQLIANDSVVLDEAEERKVSDVTVKNHFTLFSFITVLIK